MNYIKFLSKITHDYAVNYLSWENNNFSAF